MIRYKKLQFWLLIFMIPWGMSSVAQPKVRLEVFARGLEKPVDIAEAGDSRLFVVEKKGRIMIVDSLGEVGEEPFLDITDRVKIAGNEMGFLGMAFHPDYSENGYFYVNYTSLSPRRTIISRFERDTSNPNKALPHSEKILLVIAQPYNNHNGGCIQFGPDGYLYIGMGDGGSANDPANRAQNPRELLGKMLRIDVDTGDPYGIPATNPFVGDTAVLDEIWALGLRNPWRFSFDRLTGDMYIGDVGQKQVEEIDCALRRTPGGRNYGWRCYEGEDPFRTSGCGDSSQYVFPIHQYRHVDGHCSITGGYVYRGSRYPGLEGWYFFADFCSGYLGGLKQREDSTWAIQDFGFFDGYAYSSFGENYRGELFLASLRGQILRIVDETPLSTDDGVRAESLRIFPNPVRDECAFRIESPREGEEGTMTIYDRQGKELRRISYPHNAGIVTLRAYPPGLYFLEWKTKSRSIIAKVVKSP